MTVNYVHTVKEKLNEALDVSDTGGIIAEVGSGFTSRIDLGLSITDLVLVMRAVRKPRVTLDGDCSETLAHVVKLGRFELFLDGRGPRQQ